MGRRKTAKNCTVLPWLSAKLDSKEGRFIQVGNSLLLDKKFQALSHGAQMTYLCMAMEAGGNRAFVFPLSAAKKYGIASTTLRRHVDELSKAGFIDVHSNANLRQKNDYYFSLAWKEAPQ